MNQLFWQHQCNWRGQGICPQCGEMTAWDGKATIQNVPDMTEEEQLAEVRDKITIPSLKTLWEHGLIGGKSTATYPNLSEDKTVTIKEKE